MVLLTKEKTKQDLRERLGETKKLLTEGKIKEIEAISREHGLNVSAMSYFFVSLQMKALGLDGIPYLDCKTFQGWKSSGFSVCKGEHSHISGITWIRPTYKTDGGDVEDSDYIFPKEYHLFHRSQVK